MGEKELGKGRKDDIDREIEQEEQEERAMLEKAWVEDMKKRQRIN